MTTFKTLNTKKYIKQGPAVTPDTLYWKKLSAPLLVKETAAIDYIDFSPVPPYCFAVTCSVRVPIYNPITKLVIKNLARFEGNSYGGTFRKDGRLLTAGDESGAVRLFDTSSKNVLRLFKGHKAAVHRNAFTSDNLHIVSFSDDRTVKLWDISTEKAVQTYEAHSDYVRAGAVSPVSANIFLSAGYDRVINAYDTRIGGLDGVKSSVIFSINHGSPVESLIFLPTGGVFMSAGGTSVKVWDAFNSGKLMANVSHHHKTITCLRLASNGRRFMSASLDRSVKVYDIISYQPVHTFTFSNAVLSLGVAPNDETLVAGMVDGLISVQRMDDETQDEDIKRPRKKIATNISNFAVDEVVEDYEKRSEAKYDKFLRKYEYAKALDTVLLPYVVNKTPHVTVALMQELTRRRGLARSMSGRTHKQIGAIVRFLCRYIGDHRFSRILIDVANALLSIYEDTFDQFTGEIGRNFLYLRKIIRKEEQVTLEFLKLKGALDMIIAASSCGEPKEIENIEKAPILSKNNLAASEEARKDFIISV